MPDQKGRYAQAGGGSAKRAALRDPRRAFAPNVRPKSVWNAEQRVEAVRELQPEKTDRAERAGNHRDDARGIGNDADPAIDRVFLENRV